MAIFYVKQTLSSIHIPSFDCSRDAWVELNDFIQKSRFCDIAIWLSHNAAFLKGGCDIGVFDFDCRG